MPSSIRVLLMPFAFPSDYHTYIESRSYYLHPKTGMIASKAVRKRLKLKPTTYVYLRRSDDHHIIERVKVSEPEKILSLTSVKDEKVRTVLGRMHAFHQIWKNAAGQIRITIGGIVKGRRIKEILHLPFYRRYWELRMNGYEQFKNMLTAVILSYLRRRGMRLSNNRQSRERLNEQAQYLEGLRRAKYLARTPNESAQLDQKIQGVEHQMDLQRRTRRVTNVTIRIEKIGKMGPS